MKRYRFVKLELWKPKSRETLSRTLFRATNPRLSCIATVIGWGFVVLSVVGSTFLAVKAIMPTDWGRAGTSFAVTAIAVILTTLYGFLTSRWLNTDRIMMWFSTLTLTGKWLSTREMNRDTDNKVNNGDASMNGKQEASERPKVLIIDDFDRLTRGIRQELYMLFNSLHGYTRIIFVGDMEKLRKKTESDEGKDGYLGKIIDQRIMLPLSLQSDGVFQKVREAVSSLVGERIDFSAVEALFVGEKRTARDANRFLAYAAAELKGGGKLGKVQVDQELFVIYLYLFHPDEYKRLYDDRWLPAEDRNAVDPATAVLFKSSGKDSENGAAEKPLVEQYMDYLFQPRDSNPTDFRSNASAYFVNELANRHTMLELRKIIDDNGDELKTLFNIDDMSHDEKYEEFLDYVDRMGNEEYRDVQSVMETGAITVMHAETRHFPNRLVKLVFKKRVQQIDRRFRRENYDWEKLGDEYVNDFERMFDDFERRNSMNISVTERLYCYRTCLNLRGSMPFFDVYIWQGTSAINGVSLAHKFEQDMRDIVSEESFGAHPYDAEALIAQPGFHQWLDVKEAPQEVTGLLSKVKLIEELDSSEYQAFWTAYNISPGESDNGETVLRGGAPLQFELESGESYVVCVLRRLMREKNVGTEERREY